MSRVATVRAKRAVLVLFASCCALLLGAAVATHPSTNKIVKVTEGTNISVALSPDRGTLVMDLQESLWSLPMKGGQAKRLTDPLLEPARPDWSPKGNAIAFESYKGGTFHIWIMKPDGTGIEQLTEGHGDDREPRFSPDGAKIAFSSDRAFEGSYDIWVVDIASRKLTRWTSAKEDEFEPGWSPDGSRIAYVSAVAIAGPGGHGNLTSANGGKILASTEGGTPESVASAPPGAHVNSPAWSPDGKQIAYVQFEKGNSELMVSGKRVGTDDDVFPFYPTWLPNDQLLYTANGKIRVTSLDGQDSRVIPFEAQFDLHRPAYKPKTYDFDSAAARPVRGIVSPALSPDGKRVVFEALNQLWLMDIGGKPEQLTRDAFYKEDPAWSPDGKRIAYSSDKAGTEDLYILDLDTKQEQRLTSASDSAEVSAAWSADGKMLAYQDQNGATYIIGLDGSNPHMVIPAEFAPSKPSWSSNGQSLSISALKPYTHRFREGTSQILTVDLATGKLTYTEPAPFKSLSTRGEDGPVYSPDGSSVAFVMDSLLWVRPVDANGIPTAPARVINHEVTDAPTWSGDSKHLLYLSNGKLRLIALDGSARTVPLEMTWQPKEASGRTLIHAGRLWDGRGSAVQNDVDILVVNDRIQSITPHSDAAHTAAQSQDAMIVDASGQTVIPGLWESHTHEWIEGKFYGDRLGRLWLAYGVTELQSQGDPVYRAAETREAFSSGTRVGPRYFATGEAIDGERVFYNFMRPTLSDAQLRLELARAQAIGYDNLKTYVRLPHAMQEKVMAFGHDQMGVTTASHYMLPGVGFGMDGITHVSATSRFGYAYTRSAAGKTYDDVRSIFEAAHMYVISTTFEASPLYGEDPRMVEDPRLLSLNPVWDEKVLRAKRDAAVKQDQSIMLESLKREEETVSSVIEHGGIVLAGTDSPLDSVATALHLNLRAQVKYGLAPWQALQTATYLPAKAFARSKDLGSVEPGKIADLAFIAGNPLEDIKDLANVQSVMKDGQIYTVEELMTPFQK
ncbi:MAG TPA: amidohydrolase family protein [Bryobacteraceae bacterium]|nr:amidohydrolase family protein [Bryobacteraceae bacterium]